MIETVIDLCAIVTKAEEVRETLFARASTQEDFDTVRQVE